MGEVLIGGMSALLISIFLGPRFIAFLRQKEFGQHIRDEGPIEHHAKAGTPTMGGIIILAAAVIPVLILTDITRAQTAAVVGTMLACAAIGFADDWIKIVRKRSLGLPGRWKIFWQAVIAVGLWYIAKERAGLDDVMLIRIFNASIDIGPFYPVLVFLTLAGATNGVNLTDGLDGLAAGCAAIVFMTYTFMTGNGNQDDLTLISACLAGACIGFLWFNSFPAAIFMGDTGSLGLGGAIAALAVMTHTEVLLILIGGIFVIEALSVAIQVFSFRMFRRRVFLMAPIHHDFEMRGWSETKIILRFWIVAAGCAAVGFVLYLNPL
ncbi:MAG TPA: phospho-N-acetylmuramoyl-pentapeptide-transferase [Solirubrobacterales bacterium]|jgi:phospho-N-acetylmuramoyl-pentapeptide-transferase|nr:phospho-N-acetylmuramoyl-pentapeptide-transferase [Solirubrobacterales bacterium]